MRAKVIKPFNDKVSGKYSGLGDEIEVTVERFDEINRYTQHLVKVTEAKKKTAKKPAKAAEAAKETKEAEEQTK